MVRYHLAPEVVRCDSTIHKPLLKMAQTNRINEIRKHRKRLDKGEESLLTPEMVHHLDSSNSIGEGAKGRNYGTRGIENYVSTKKSMDIAMYLREAPSLAGGYPSRETNMNKACCRRSEKINSKGLGSLGGDVQNRSTRVGLYENNFLMLSYCLGTVF